LVVIDEFLTVLYGTDMVRRNYVTVTLSCIHYVRWTVIFLTCCLVTYLSTTLVAKAEPSVGHVYVSVS